MPAAGPMLRAWLARAEPMEPAPPRGLESVIFALFDVDTADGDLPVAAVTRALDVGVIDKSWWLRADPVHLRPERDRLVLLDGAALGLTQPEANSLVAEIAEPYIADGWVFKAARPDRWYLKPPRAAKITTTPLPIVVGKDIHPYLPAGKEGKAWHTVLNEIQILLHTAAVNADREQRGLMPINSVWFWGGGRLPVIKPTLWAQVWSHEPASLALARLTETPSADVPENFSQLRTVGSAPGAHLLVLDQARTAVQYGDTARWLEFMQRLERHWLVPIWRAVKQGALRDATLYSDTGQAFHLTARYARRWWRRRTRLDGFGL